MNIKRVLYIFLCGVALCVFSHALFAQAPAALPTAQVDYSRVILGIRYEGLSNVDPKLLPAPHQLNIRPGRRATRSDLAEDLNKLYLTGYFHNINAHTQVVNGQTILIYRFIENPIVTRISVSGNVVISNEKIKSLMNTKKGEVFNLVQIEKDREAIESFYKENGYELSKIRTIDITQDGQLFVHVLSPTVNAIHIQGLKDIKPFVVYREIDLQIGDVYNTQTLRRDRDRILQLGYFADVSAPVIQNTQTEDSVDIYITVSEYKINRIDFGLETERDIVLGFAKLVNNHNLIHSDVLFGKIQVGTEGDSSLEVRSYSARYYQPYFLNYFGFATEFNVWNELRRERLTNQSTDVYQNRRIGLDSSVIFPLIRDRLSLTFTGKIEQVKLPEDAPSQIPDNRYSIRSIATRLNFTTLEDIHRPQNGQYFIISHEKGGDFGFFNAGGLNFNRFRAEYAKFFKVSEPSVIGFHMQGGFFRPDEYNDATFETEGFELGGANSLRGYKELTFFGNRELLFNVEYRHDFSESIQGALFWDTGTTFSRDVPNFEQFAWGTGAGVRFHTPLGPIRLDFAWPKTELLNIDKTIIHFSVGQLF